MGRKHLRLLALLACTSLLTSCALLPEEEAVRTAPVLREFEQESYETAVVQRGDLVHSDRISAKYVPVQKQSISFGLLGEYVDQIFVKMGDSVKAGQLLGQLELGDLQERIAAMEDEVFELELRLSYLEQEYSLALRRHEIATENQDRETVAKALELLQEQFDARRQSLSDQLSLKALSLKELNADLAARQIYAPFAGTVTYVRDFEKGHVTAYAETAVTIADSTVTLFRAETKNWNAFQIGGIYEITVGKDVFTLEAVSEEELGIEAKEKTEGKKAYVYFRLTEPNLGLEEGDYGTIELELNRREDVLYVPSSAVKDAGEMHLVYYQREDGMKGYKEVEIGTTIGKNTEIVSGLEEGEEIIAG